MHAKHLTAACKDPGAPIGRLLAGTQADPRLGWLLALAGPVQEPSQAEAARISSLLRLSSALGHEDPSSLQQTAFQALVAVPHFDAPLAAACFQPRHRNELEVLRAIVASQRCRGCLQEAEREFASWRARGLYYPLLVAARNMPDPRDWLGAGRQDGAAARGLAKCLAALPAARTHDEVRAAIRAFVASQAGGGPAAQAVARTLDRVAILMRVKSNAVAPRDHDLDACLAAFPDLGAMDVPDIWACVKPALEAALPPSLLCSDLTGPRRATW